MDEQVRRRKPHRPAPVGISAFQLHLGFPRFVSQRAVTELKRVLAMMLRETADPVRRKKLIRIPDALQQALELGRIRDRENVTPVSVADPVRAGLVFAGTRDGVSVSFDNGATWQPVRLNMPPVAINDLDKKYRK